MQIDEKNQCFLLQPQARLYPSESSGEWCVWVWLFWLWLFTGAFILIKGRGKDYCLYS